MKHILTLTLMLSPAMAAGQSVLYSAAGDRPSQHFGYSLARVGDLDGDGFDDFIVGQPNGGRIVVYSGRQRSERFEITGELGSFGHAVAGAGDVNGDAVADFVVGAPDWNSRGRAVVYSGSDGTLLYAYQSDQSGGLGYAVAGVGDVNTDGYDDFALGAPYHNESGLGEVGLVRVQSGRDGTELLRFTGPIKYGYYGQALDGAGDVDLDGAPDLIIGAPAGVGLAEIRSGQNGDLLYALAGEKYPDQFGHAVAPAGDMDHDGFADVAVGAPGAYPDAGYVKVVSGRDGAVQFALRDKADRGAYFGWAISVAEFDGDGTADLLIGAMNDLPFYVGSARVFSGVTQAELFTVRGNAEVTRVGWAVALADINGDKLMDPVVAAPWADAPADAAGLVLAVSRDTPLASWSNYASGWPGRYGIPAFNGEDPALCSRINVFVGNSSGITAAAVMFIGLAQADLPTWWDGHLRVLPLSVVSLALSFTGAYVPIEVPCDVTLVGLEIFLQALQLDTSASKGVSFTPGLKLVLGGAAIPG